MNRARHPGFTLIELSLVLVIVGMIVGGVVGGAEMIRQATIRKQISDIEMIKLSVQAYKLQYNVVPSDWNNDGYVNGAWVNQLEIWYFFTTLKSEKYLSCVCAGYVSWDPNYSPANEYYPGRLPESYLVVYGGPVPGGSGSLPSARDNLPENYIELGPGQPTGTPSTYNPVLTTIDVFAMDSKMDDGLPLSGSYMAVGKGAQWGSDDWWLPHAASQGGAGSANCVNTSVSPNAYNTAYAGKICSLRVKGGF